jgi:hypothetical protein
MKLFIKKFSVTPTQITWWVYYAEDGKGYAVKGLYTYADARSWKLDRQDITTKAYFRELHTYIADRNRGGVYEPAMIVNE